MKARWKTSRQPSLEQSEFLLLFITEACGGVHGVSSFPTLPLPSNHRHAVKGGARTPGLVRTYGGDREMYRCRDVAHVDVMDSSTLYGTRIAHRMAESGYTSAECTNPSINQVSRRIL